MVRLLLLFPILIFAQVRTSVPDSLTRNYWKAQYELTVAEDAANKARETWKITVDKMNAYCFNQKAKLAIVNGDHVCESVR